MHDRFTNDAGVDGEPQTTDGVRRCRPATLAVRDVFRQLIADEVRNGRMTPSVRRRIVRYAAAMGLSAVEAGQLISACSAELEESGDPLQNHHALRLVKAPPERFPAALKVALVIALAIIVDVLLAVWLW